MIHNKTTFNILALVALCLVAYGLSTLVTVSPQNTTAPSDGISALFGNKPSASDNQQPTTPAVPVTVTADDHRTGNANGDITIVEYSDIDCPFCKKLHPELAQILASDPGVSLVYRHFPLTNLHPDAYNKALFTECVAQIAGNNAFWSAINSLMTDGTTLQVASALGIDTAKLTTCMTQTSTKQLVDADVASANALEVQGTPYLVIINNTSNAQYVIPGFASADMITQVITQVRAQ